MRKIWLLAFMACIPLAQASPQAWGFLQGRLEGKSFATQMWSGSAAAILQGSPSQKDCLIGSLFEIPLSDQIARIQKRRPPNRNRCETGIHGYLLNGKKATTPICEP